jgi:Fic family protein
LQSETTVNPADFHAPHAGRIVRTAGGNAAFVPAPLPPELAFDLDLVRAMSRADAALSELSGLGALLPNPHLLIAPYLRREAVLSSRIEGTQASLADLLADEAGEASHAAPDDVREVRNYVAALEYGVRRLDALPLSLRLVRELHEKLMKGVRGEKATPGEFRRRQNWIGPKDCTEAVATYVPPPVREMKEALFDWEKFLHQRDTLPELVQCALMHEQFEAIHPFLDGNGRVGRLLITLFLIERGRLSQPLLYLSEYIERHKQDYYDALQRVRTHGAWSEWLRYFFEGVRWSAARGVDRRIVRQSVHQRGTRKGHSRRDRPDRAQCACASGKGRDRPRDHRPHLGKDVSRARRAESHRASQRTRRMKSMETYSAPRFRHDNYEL